MSEESEKTQGSRTLHDRLFKEFLHRFLADFLWVFFPAEAERLNFATLRFLDKELIINTENIFGHEVLRFQYGQVGVRDLSGQTYLQENSPVAAALTVLMQPEGESQAWLKLLALQKVVESDLSDGTNCFWSSL